MKLVTFTTASGERHIGALRKGEAEIVDFTASDPSSCFGDMIALIDGGDAALDRAQKLLASGTNVVPVSKVRLLAPIPEPRQIRDFQCSEIHVRNAVVQARRLGFVLGFSGAHTTPQDVKLPDIWYRQPPFYKANRFNVVGPDHEIQWPEGEKHLDYELGFGFVVGKKGRDIPVEQAFEHVFGYCIFNDITARDIQFAEMSCQLGPAKGKDFDTGNILGPWLVTQDEIPDPYALEMVARVNGKEWSRGKYETNYHKIDKLIAHVSRGETIYPGEFFGLGTVGNGSGIEIGQFLQPGDTIEIDVPKMGILRNRIGHPAH